MTGEALLFVCEETWNGDIEELEKDYLYPEKPVIGDDWPSAEKLEEEFPQLYKRFWDEENIKALN